YVEQTIEIGIEDNNLKHISLNKALLEFNQQHKNPILINQKQVGFEVLTTIQKLRELTNNFTNCQLSIYLKEELPNDMKISWGVDSNLENAKRYAIDGIRMLTNKISEEDTILNYFGKWTVLEQNTSVTNIPDLLRNKIYQISNYLEIS